MVMMMEGRRMKVMLWRKGGLIHKGSKCGELCVEVR